MTKDVVVVNKSGYIPSKRITLFLCDPADSEGSV